MGKFAYYWDRFWGGSGQKYAEGDNPFKDKAEVKPEKKEGDPPTARPVPASEPAPAPAAPNPFGSDEPEPAPAPQSAASVAPEAPAPEAPEPSAPAPAAPAAPKENPYKRATAPAENEVQRTPADMQVFKGYALRLWRKYTVHDGPELFYDFYDAEGCYTKENPHLSEAQVRALIRDDLKQGKLILQPVELNFAGQGNDKLPMDSEMSQLLFKLYRGETGVAQPDEPAPNPEPQKPEDPAAPAPASPVEAEPSQQEPEAPPAPPAEPEPTPAAPAAPAEPEPTPEPKVAPEPPAEPTPPAPAEASRGPMLDTSALMALVQEKDRPAVYAVLMQSMLSNRAMSTEELIAAMSAAMQSAPVPTPDPKPAQSQFVPINTPNLD